MWRKLRARAWMLALLAATLSGPLGLHLQAQTPPAADVGASAPSPLPPLPRTLPTGYVIEDKGRVRWIYPTSAAGEVAELQRAQPRLWRQLTGAFGQPVAPELDIRVAIDPGDMRRLVDGRALPDHSTGVAFPAQGLILMSLTAPGSWLRPNMTQLLTHELSHVALHRAVGGQSIPRWFTEGVAVHQAGERSLARIRTLWTGTLTKDLMPVEQLSQAFPRDHHEVALAYAQSADLVRYLLDSEADRKRFVDLIGALRAGKAFPEAIMTAYHVSLGYIEREWRNEITRRYGRWPSALAGLTGIWAVGALLLVVGFVRTRRRHHRTLARWQAEEAEADARALLRKVQQHQVQRPPPSPAHRVDEMFDRLEEGRRNPAEIPTVEHEGRSYTLH